MTRIQYLASRTLWSAAALAVLASCKSDTTAPPSASAIVATSDVNMTGIVGELAPTSLSVRVTDASGHGLSGQAVTFNVVAGGGTVTPTVDSTDAQGLAFAVWRLGSATGSQRAQAQVPGVSSVATFNATAAAGAPASVAISAGDNQTATVTQLVTVAPSVLLKDRFNNPVPGVSVFFSVSAGGGSLLSSGAITNASGVAAADGWRLGPGVGVNRLTALAVTSGAANNPVVFTATATSGPAATATAETNTAVSGVVGTLVLPAPSVRIVDAGGNPVSGVQVTFAGSTGSTVSGGSKVTNQSGIATVDAWQLGSTVQTYTMTATIAGVSPVTFTATARAGSAATVTLAAGNNQTAFVGKPVAIEPSVRLTDSFGNPVSGVEVVFEVTAGAGVAVARRPVTNANGVAEVGGWTLGDDPGVNTLRATVSASGITGNPVTFTATATPGLPASVTILSGNNQSVVGGLSLPDQPSVIVRDNRGNPINGVTVNFIVGSGGGSVTGGTKVTANGGVATVGGWTLGVGVGNQTLLARVTGIPDAVFTATALAGTPSGVTAVSADPGANQANGLVVNLPSVLVRDAQGNPVSGAAVTFQLDVVNGATITGAAQTTNAQGIATLGSWRVGTLAGSVSRVRVFVAGIDLQGNEPTFQASVVAGPAAAISVFGTAPTTGTENTAVSPSPTVRVVDAFNNPVPGVEVIFSAISGNGTITDGNQTTDDNGVASVGTWTLPAGHGGAIFRTISATVFGNASLTIGFTVSVP